MKSCESHKHHLTLYENGLVTVKDHVVEVLTILEWKTLMNLITLSEPTNQVCKQVTVQNRCGCVGKSNGGLGKYWSIYIYLQID